jgi:3-methyladenine DNA glycosylase AlkD
MTPLDVAAARAELDAALQGAGTPERAAQEQRYLKSDLRHYGATMPVIHRVVRAFVKAHPELTRADLRALVEALWAPGIHELRVAATELMTLRVGLLEPANLAWLEPFLRTARTWALVDPLAAEVVGPLADRAPDGARVLLDRWAADADHWMRRTVLLRFLLPVRRGDRAAFVAFAEYADRMLEEPEFFIRKAIGWVLREYGKREPAEVAGWLEPRLARAAGLTVREACKHLPDATREALLAARGTAMSRPGSVPR